MTDLIIVGAGPAGLSCAIEARKQGLQSIVLEQGGITDAIRRFPTNLVWFSTPDLLSLGEVPFVTSAFRPTRADTLNYYRAVVNHYALDVRCHDAVTEIRRLLDGRFGILTVRGVRYEARNTVIATGYFDHASRLGVPGEQQERVRHYYDEPFRYSGCDILVVGGRNSAVEAALDLYRHGAEVTLVHRGPAFSQGVKYWILPDIENRVRAGQVRALFGSTVREFRERRATVQTARGVEEVGFDFAFVLIGYQPDSCFLESAGIRVDPLTLGPACNPDTFETTIPGLFVAGSVVAGRETNRIFVENGRLHGGHIVTAIVSRRPALP
jgi:thioredoxin reductase (NADPH)